MYFLLSGTVYLPGDAVLITDIGRFTDTTLEGTANSLVCHTGNVNTQCCRGSDGGNVGEWFFPDGSMVPRHSAGGPWTRSGFTEQVRLNRNTDTLVPTGDFSCRVLDSDGVILNEVVTVILGKCHSMDR